MVVLSLSSTSSGTSFDNQTVHLNEEGDDGTDDHDIKEMMVLIIIMKKEMMVEFIIPRNSTLSISNAPPSFARNSFYPKLILEVYYVLKQLMLRLSRQQKYIY